MSITKELREFASHLDLGKVALAGWKEALLAIADRIDEEHERACAEAWDNGYESDYLGIEKWLTEHPQVMEHHGWIRLPVDADGMPVHIGDVMEWPDGKAFEVIGFGDGVLFYTEDEESADWTGASTKRHHAPTVEDVLRQVIACANNGTHVHGALDTEQIVAEYAAKLQLREDA